MKNRENFKKWLQEPPVEQGAIDDLDRKALDGYAYLDKDKDFDESMNRLDQRFKALATEASPSKPTAVVRSMRQKRLMGIAAAILLLVSPMLYFLNSPVSDSRLFAEHFEAPRSPYLLTSRGEGAQENQDLTAAFTLYEKGNHTEAFPAIENLVEKYPDQKDLNYYAGISALAIDQTEDAIKLFALAQQSDYQEVDEKSSYFLALAHLKLGNRDEAREWLTKAETGVYGDKAKMLSKELD